MNPSLKLPFTTIRSSTFSGFNLALFGVTKLLSAEKTRWDLDEAADTEKNTLTSLVRRGNWDSWCFYHSSDDFLASHLAGFYLHKSHFAMAPSRLSPKYLQTLDACFFGTTLFFWMGGMAVDWRDKYVLIIFQFFVNIIWITKHSLFNSVPLHEMELQKMTKELASRP